MVNDLPAVGQIQGLIFSRAATPKDSKVLLQYTDQQGIWHQATVPFLDAMYLLNLLKAMQIESGFPMPDDPYAKPQKP